MHPRALADDRNVLPGVRQWQDLAAVRSRAAIRGGFFASCVPEGASDGKSAPSWQHIAAMHPKRAGFGKIFAPCIRKAPQTVVWEYTARRSCQEGALFAARASQIMHGAQILPFLGAPFECFGLSRAGRGRCSRFAHCPPLLCTGGAVVSRARPHAASFRSHRCRRVRVATELAVACRLPQKTWRCDGVSLNCRCSAVLF